MEETLFLGKTCIDRLSDRVRVGAIANYTASPFDTLLIAPALWVSPLERLTLLAAPGVEFESGEGGEPAIRLGVAYSASLGKVYVTPLVYWDLVNDREGSVVAGLAVGAGF